MFSGQNRIGRDFFAEIMKSGGRFSTSLFSIKYRNETQRIGMPKFSVVVSKKISNKATKRNNTKRRVYHAIRELLKENEISGLPAIIFFVKTDLEKLDFKRLKLAVEEVFKKIQP